MAFAIYYFKEDKAVEVGKITWMSAEDQQTTQIITQCPDLEDENGWIPVKWSKKGKKKKGDPTCFPAKVLLIGDNYSDLCKKRQAFIDGKDIWQEAAKRKVKPNSKFTEEEEEEEEVPPKKKKPKKGCAEKEASNRMIEDLKQQMESKYSPSSELTNSSDEYSEEELPRNWSAAQKRIKELQRENQVLKKENVKQILDAMTELPAVVAQLKQVIKNVKSTPASPASTSCMSPTPSASSMSPTPSALFAAITQAASDPDEMVPLMPGSEVTVLKRKLKNLRATNPSVFVGDLAVLVFGKETLANSCLTGRQSGAHKDLESKPPLDNTKLEATIAYVQAKYPDVTIQVIRSVIRKKCNNLAFVSKKVVEKKAI